MVSLRQLRTTHPNLTAFSLALAFGAFGAVVILGGFGTGSTDHDLMRVAFLAALTLLTFDTLETTYIGYAHPQDGETHHRWYHAFYLGYSWTVGIILLTWPGIQAAMPHVVIVALGGAVFGLFVLRVMADTDTPILEDRYDLEDPITLRGRGWIYTIWPGITVAFLVIYPLSGSGEELNERFYLFQIVLMGGLMRLYELKRSWSYDQLPYLLGGACLVIGLIWL